MATSSRNQLGVGGARKLSALESTLPVADKYMFGAQPHGALDGRFTQIPSSHLLQELGRRWILTTVDTATGDATGVRAIQAATATEGPFVRLTTNANVADSEQLQYAAAQTASTTAAGSITAYAPFIAKAGYNIHFGMRIRIGTTVANAAVLFGLAEVDTTLMASHVISTASLIGFYKAASATMGGVVRASSTSTTTALTVGGTSGWTPTVSTWYDIGFKLVGRDSITFYVDGEATGSTTMTNLPANTVLLCPSICLAPGTSAIATMDISGFYCGQEAR